jgi:hypothetical protein
MGFTSFFMLHLRDIDAVVVAMRADPYVPSHARPPASSDGGQNRFRTVLWAATLRQAILPTLRGRRDCSFGGGSSPKPNTAPPEDSVRVPTCQSDSAYQILGTIGIRPPCQFEPTNLMLGYGAHALPSEPGLPLETRQSRANVLSQAELVLGERR